jgi:hypothetical protein
MNGNVCVYSFADASSLTKYVEDTGADYFFTGTWSSNGTYLATPLMAAQYGAALYMCIRDNVGDNPQRPVTRSRPTSWSIMSLLYEYQCTGTTSDTGSLAYALAGSAYELAGSAYTMAGSALGILSTGLSGTYSFWVSGTEGAAPHTNITFVNGLLVAVA